MLRLDTVRVKKRINELQNFEGFLPFQFDSYINLNEREEFLKSKGLWDTVHKKELGVMKGIRDTRPNDDIYLDKILFKWVKDNPQFKDLILNE